MQRASWKPAGVGKASLALQRNTRKYHGNSKKPATFFVTDLLSLSFSYHLSLSLSFLRFLLPSRIECVFLQFLIPPDHPYILVGINEQQRGYFERSINYNRVVLVILYRMEAAWIVNGISVTLGLCSLSCNLS